jgi:hypothetical protein
MQYRRARSRRTADVRPATDRRARRHRSSRRDASRRPDQGWGLDRDRTRPVLRRLRCELKVQAINRIGLQFLFGAQFQLAYLTRINATIERLLDLYD